jgi:hypothetical protein
VILFLRPRPDGIYGADLPRNVLTTLYRVTVIQAHNFANQWSLSSFGFTIAKSRSTTSRLAAQATAIMAVPVIQ